MDVVSEPTMEEEERAVVTQKKKTASETYTKVLYGTFSSDLYLILGSLHN